MPCGERGGWHAKVKALQAQIADWTNTITLATKAREEHALAAALGESTAVAVVKKARTEQHDAEQHIDLQIALPAAREQLANAERAATAARRELAMHQAQGMMRARVAAGARMDAGFAAIAEAYLEYESLGKQLQSFPDLDLAQGGGMARWEDTTGLKRLAAALPPFMKTLPTWTLTHPAKFVPLAESEARFWSLPPEQPEKAKAA